MKDYSLVLWGFVDVTGGAVLLAGLVFAIKPVPEASKFETEYLPDKKRALSSGGGPLVAWIAGPGRYVEHP